MYALNLEKPTNRILSATLPEYAAPDAVLVEAIPDGDITDYLYSDGIFIYEPLPKPDERAAFKVTRNITAGEYITINGQMYKAISNIPNGGYVIEGQNAIKTTIEAELLALQQKGE
jgi:hypothetical protein